MRPCQTERCIVADRVPTSRLARSGKIGKFAARQAVRNARLRFTKMANPENADEQAVAKAFVDAADELVEMLGAMKGAAMKVGQMLSILDVKMVPRQHREHFQKQLATLRDSAPAVSFDKMRSVIEEDLGRTISDAFADFDPVPVAAASIGQVYRARLHDGRDVAVKVQYAGIASAVRADLKNLALLLKFSKPILPTFDSRAFLDELRYHLEEELDYVQEARTQHELALHYAGHPTVVVPDTISELSGKRVLVTEFVQGKRFDEICALPAETRNRVGEIIYRFYVGSMHVDNQFNGDPHPGNVLLADDGRVAFIDFGLFKRMNPAAVEFERDCIRAAMEGRADDFRTLLSGGGVLRPDADIASDDLLAYAYDASPWTFDDEELTVTRELAGGALMLIADPRSTDFERMHKENLPPEHFFSRRADFYTFGVIGQLEATANWHRIAREWIYGELPSTSVGEADATWRTARAAARS